MGFVLLGGSVEYTFTGLIPFHRSVLDRVEVAYTHTSIESKGKYKECNLPTIHIEPFPPVPAADFPCAVFFTCLQTLVLIH